MQSISSFAVFLCLLLNTASFAWGGELPHLNQTRLFTETAEDCLNVDLDKWVHPTKTVLEHNAVEIVSVSLCNDGKYPIFYVRFKYDPQGQTADYFKPLYKKMKKANSNYPFSFVALSDNTVVRVSFRKNGYIDTEFEMYKP